MGGEQAAGLAGRTGDGLIATSPSTETVKAFEDAGGQGKPRYGQATFCWGRDKREQIRLARWGASLPRENIEFYTLQGKIGSTQAGESVVRADKREADATLDRVFGTNEAEFRP